MQNYLQLKHLGKLKTIMKNIFGGYLGSHMGSLAKPVKPKSLMLCTLK
jgi:hypothetical protein